MLWNRSSHALFLILRSGCSSSATGIHLACESLRQGKTKLAVAAGVNLVMNRRNPMRGDYETAAVLAKDYRCKTFDER